jgi:hypothetical protein
MMPSRLCRARPRGRGCSSWIEPRAASAVPMVVFPPS